MHSPRWRGNRDQPDTETLEIQWSIIEDAAVEWLSKKSPDISEFIANNAPWLFNWGPPTLSAILVVSFVWWLTRSKTKFITSEPRYSANELERLGIIENQPRQGGGGIVSATAKRTILVMSYSDGSGKPRICPYILSPQEVQIAQWILDNSGHDRHQFQDAEEWLDPEYDGGRDLPNPED